jgi:hypothetical protein
MKGVKWIVIYRTGGGFTKTVNIVGDLYDVQNFLDDEDIPYKLVISITFVEE